MTCNTPTGHPDNPSPLTAKPAAASAPMASEPPSPASMPASPPAPGSATAAAASTLSASAPVASAPGKTMIAQAAALSRQPAPTANSLFLNIEWYAARPGTRPSPLTVQFWIRQNAQLIWEYQNLLAVLVEMQVEAIDYQCQANAQPSEETQP